VAPVPGPLLDKLIAKAFAANADLRVAAANLQRAHGVLEEVEEKKRPEVEASAAPLYGRIAGASLGLPEQLPRTGIYDGDIKVAYQLDVWGRIRRAIEAAEADQEAAQAAADLAHVMVAADTTRAYAEACSAGYQLKVAQQSVELQQKFVKLTGERVQRGRGIAIDNSRAQAQLEQLRANLPPLEARRRTALYRLAVLTGEVPSQFPAEVAAARRRRASPARSRSATAPPCCAAVRTCARPSACWPAPPPASAWPPPSCTRTSASAPRSAASVSWTSSGMRIPGSSRSAR
jgi:outer membrane protein TolC